MTVSRPLRNQNPGDLRIDPNFTWVGQVVPGDDPDFCQFDTMIHGVRALAEDLLNQQLLHGLRTLRTIATKYAPPAENDTATYIENLADSTGYDPDAVLDLRTDEDLLAVTKAFATCECGPDVSQITDAQFAAGVNDALASKHL
jgi:hypothetical protein